MAVNPRDLPVSVSSRVGFQGCAAMSTSSKHGFQDQIQAATHAALLMKLFPQPPRKVLRVKSTRQGTKKGWGKKKRKASTEALRQKQMRPAARRKRRPLTGVLEAKGKEGVGKTDPPGGGEPLTPLPGTFCLWWHYSYYIFLLLTTDSLSENDSGLFCFLACDALNQHHSQCVTHFSERDRIKQKHCM